MFSFLRGQKKSRCAGRSSLFGKCGCKRLGARNLSMEPLEARQLLSVSQVVDDGDALRYAEAGTSWAGSVDSAAYQEDFRYHAAGDADQQAAWTFDSLEPGATYQVFATWTPGSSRATNAPFTIGDGVGPASTVRVNQQVAPLDLTVEGTAWQSLGTYTVGGETLTVSLSADANGYVIADALRLVEVDRRHDLLRRSQRRRQRRQRDHLHHRQLDRSHLRPSRQHDQRPQAGRRHHASTLRLRCLEPACCRPRRRFRRAG